jgi:hypothetical protein
MRRERACWDDDSVNVPICLPRLLHCWGQGMVNRELIRNESTSLVRTQDSDTIKVFDSSDSTDTGNNGLVAGKLLGTDGEH